mgnify:CR=1 FL=1
MNKCFEGGALYLLHNLLVDPSMNEALMDYQCVRAWGKYGGSCFTHYIIHIAQIHTIMLLNDHIQVLTCAH